MLYRRLKESLGEMEAQLKTLCRSDQLEMSKDLERVVMAGGKRLRPLSGMDLSSNRRWEEDGDSAADVYAGADAYSLADS